MDITIHFNNGKGSFKTDLSLFLPCTKGDFSRLLSMVDEDPDNFTVVSSISEYITGRIDELKSRIENAWGANKKAFQSEIEKLSSLHNVLSKKYGISEIEQAPEKIKLKKADFYTMIMGENRNLIAVLKSGYIFRMEEFTFAVYKNNKGFSNYCIIIPSIGLECASCNKRNEIISSITPNLIRLIREKVNNGEFAEYEKRFHKVFHDCMENDSVTILEKPVALMQRITADEPETAEQATNTAENAHEQTAEQAQEQPETTAEQPAQDTQTAQTMGEHDTGEQAPETAKTALFYYGMLHRGFSIGCQPMAGLIRREDSTDKRYYDVLVYDRELSDGELSDYELEYIQLATEQAPETDTTGHAENHEPGEDFPTTDQEQPDTVEQDTTGIEQTATGIEQPDTTGQPATVEQTSAQTTEAHEQARTSPNRPTKTTPRQAIKAHNGAKRTQARETRRKPVLFQNRLKKPLKSPPILALVAVVVAFVTPSKKAA